MKHFEKEWKNIKIIVSNQDGWHLAVVGKNRMPTFNEVKKARYKYIPDNVCMSMLFPPKKDYVNIHRYCLHLFQIYQKK